VEVRKELVPIPEEQAVIWLVEHLRGRGWALARIAAELEAMGLRNRAGAPFTRQAVHQLLRREAAAEQLADTG
jgi:hypothetical protein